MRILREKTDTYDSNELKEEFEKLGFKAWHRNHFRLVQKKNGDEVLQEPHCNLIDLTGKPISKLRKEEKTRYCDVLPIDDEKTFDLVFDLHQRNGHLKIDPLRIKAQEIYGSSISTQICRLVWYHCPVCKQNKRRGKQTSPFLSNYQKFVVEENLMVDNVEIGTGNEEENDNYEVGNENENDNYGVGATGNIETNTMFEGFFDTLLFKGVNYLPSSLLQYKGESRSSDVTISIPVIPKGGLEAQQSSLLHCFYENLKTNLPVLNKDSDLEEFLHELFLKLLSKTQDISNIHRSNNHQSNIHHSNFHQSNIQHEYLESSNIHAEYSQRSNQMEESKIQPIGVEEMGQEQIEHSQVLEVSRDGVEDLDHDFNTPHEELASALLTLKQPSCSASTSAEIEKDRILMSQESHQMLSQEEHEQFFDYLRKQKYFQLKSRESVVIPADGDGATLIVPIANQGNNCYCIAMVQLLSVCYEFWTLLKGTIDINKEVDHILQEKTMTFVTLLTVSLQKVEFVHCYQQELKPAATDFSLFISGRNQSMPIYKENNQEDITEFFVHYLAKITDESYDEEEFKLSRKDEEKNTFEKNLNALITFQLNEDSTCHICRRKRNKPGNPVPYHAFGLQFPDDATNKMSTQSLLDIFMGNDVCEKKCSHCSITTKHDESKEIVFLPEYAFIIFQRFNYVDSECKKLCNEITCSRSIEIPFKGSSVTYYLQGVVCHEGQSPNVGHYTTFLIEKDFCHYHFLNDKLHCTVNEEEFDKYTRRHSYMSMYSKHKPQIFKSYIYKQLVPEWIKNKTFYDTYFRRKMPDRKKRSRVSNFKVGKDIKEKKQLTLFDIMENTVNKVGQHATTPKKNTSYSVRMKSKFLFEISNIYTKIRIFLYNFKFL